RPPAPRRGSSSPSLAMRKVMGPRLDTSTMGRSGVSVTGASGTASSYSGSPLFLPAHAASSPIRKDGAVHVVAAPDKLRGTLAAREAAAAIGRAVVAAGHTCDEIPLADGGEG